jgi:kynurenine formamidase
MCLPGTIEAVREAQPQVTRRAALAGGGAAALAALVPGTASAQPPSRVRFRGRVADLTHPFTAGFPVYTGEEPRRRTLKRFDPDGFYSQEWTFGEHSGTHMDAPGHFVQGRRLVPQIRPAELLLPIVVIDIAARAARNPDAVVTPDDLRRFERRHGRIPRTALVAMHSGWGPKVGTPAYLGRDAGGTYHFPGWGVEAVQWLIERRRGAALGVDTLSLDPGPSATFQVHRDWLGTDRYGVEALANLDRIPAHGATVTVGVIPWEQGSGGPARVLATY